MREQVRQGVTAPRAGCRRRLEAEARIGARGSGTTGQERREEGVEFAGFAAIRRRSCNPAESVMEVTQDLGGAGRRNELEPADIPVVRNDANERE